MQTHDEAISEKFSLKQTLVSVEFFPPKNEEGARQILRTAHKMRELKPDFVSITYGAGGSTRERTLDYGDLIREIFEFDVMPHLTCVGHTKDELAELIERFYSKGFRNIMTLRGDPPKGETDFQPHPDGLAYASELVAFIRERYPDFCLGVAGYPEKHPEATDMETDLRNLKHKVNQGASFITTQLFFDNEDYINFVQKCRDIGIVVPIVPGLLPILSKAQLNRLLKFCDTRIPEKLQAKLDAAKDEKAELQVGIDWAYEQCKGLIQSGAPGIHFYIMNRSHSTLEVYNRLKSEGVL